MDIYNTARYYRDIDALRHDSRTILEVIGTTTLGRPIHMLTRGSARYGTMLIVGGMHAREYITTPLLLRLAREYRGRARLCVIPSINVDGLALVTEGIDSVSDEGVREYLIRVNGGSSDFSNWKANAKAVDLNVNFDVGWGNGTSNIRYPAPANYIGAKPMSEVENKILAGVTFQLEPDILLTYHTRGNVIYEGYEGVTPYHSEAQRIADYTHYELCHSRGSHGGYKDMFVSRYRRLGLTIECGCDSLEHPIGMAHLDEIYLAHRGLFDMIDSDIMSLMRSDDGYKIHENGDR